MRFLVLAACTAVICGCATTSTSATPFLNTDPGPKPEGYDDPGPRPDMDTLLNALASEMHSSLKDPYSVRDLRLCEPETTEAESIGAQWTPASWKFSFALNAKNSYGAYGGMTHYLGRYRKGEVLNTLNLSDAVRRYGSGPSYDPQRFEGCRAVSDDEWLAAIDAR